jgi:hypothetical protein
MPVIVACGDPNIWATIRLAERVLPAQRWPRPKEALSLSASDVAEGAARLIAIARAHSVGQVGGRQRSSLSRRSRTPSSSRMPKCSKAGRRGRVFSAGAMATPPSERGQAGRRHRLSAGVRCSHPTASITKPMSTNGSSARQQRRRAGRSPPPPASRTARHLRPKGAISRRCQRIRI